MFVSDVPLHCINEAAIEFNVPAKLLITILNIERGKAGKAVKNFNGSYDLGPMQINTTWLPILKQYSISKTDILNNPCLNIKVGAWILGKSISHERNLLLGVGDYHSHTTKYNTDYTLKIKIHFTKLNSILKGDQQNELY